VFKFVTVILICHCLEHIGLIYTIIYFLCLVKENAIWALSRYSFGL
jgi:hypothetical protein